MAPLQFLKVIIVVTLRGVKPRSRNICSIALLLSCGTAPSRSKSLALNSYLKTIDNPNLFCIFTDDDIEMRRGLLRKIYPFGTNGTQQRLRAAASFNGSEATDNGLAFDVIFRSFIEKTLGNP
jgi:hypothetical protein